MGTLKKIFSQLSNGKDGIFKKSSIFNKTFKNSFPQNDSKIRIIYINDSISEIVKALKTFELRHMPQVFAFSIKIKTDNQYENHKEIMSIIEDKVIKRSIILEICDEQKHIFIHNSKRRTNEAFWNEIKMTHDEIKNIEINFPRNFFVNILSSFKETSFIYINEDELKNILHGIELQEIYSNAIKSRDEIDVRLLNLVLPKDNRLISKDELKNLISNTLEINTFLAISNVYEMDEITKAHVKDLVAMDNDVLQVAVESRNLNLVRVILKFFKDIIKSNYTSFTPPEDILDFALKHEYFDICQEFKKAKLTSKSKVHYNDLLRTYEETIDKISNLHKYIKEGNFDKVSEFTVKNPHLKFCINSIENSSALLSSIQHKRFKIYSLLLCKGYKCNKEDEIMEKIMELESSQKLMIRNENLNNIFIDENAHHQILGFKCYFLTGSNDHWKLIEKMIKDLSSDERLKRIIQLNLIGNTEFFFDLNREHVDVLDPTCAGKKKHASLAKSKVFLGNCGIFKNENSKALYGEFCRQASYIAVQNVFQNNYLPYNEVEKEEEYCKAISEMLNSDATCDENYFEVVQTILTCDESEQRTQIIHLIPYFLGYFLKNEFDFMNVEKWYGLLIRFYNNHVDSKFFKQIKQHKKDINYKLGLLECIEKSPYQIDQGSKKDLVDLLKERTSKHLIISTNVPQLLFSNILRDIDFIDDKLHTNSTIAFVDVDKLKNQVIKQNFEDLLIMDEIKLMIVNGQNVTQENYEFLEEISSIITIIIVQDIKNSSLQNLKSFQKLSFSYKWNDLSDLSKSHVLESEVTFQGKKIKFVDLIPKSSIKNIPNEALCYLCSENIIINGGNLLKKSFPIQHSILNNSNTSMNLDDFIDDVKNNKIVLISDLPKKGKTVLLQQLYENILSNSPNNWVSYFERQIYNVLNLMHTVEKENDFISKMCPHINPLEKFVLEQKLNKGQVKFLIDGKDDCPNENREFIKTFSKKFNCQLFMACRTHLEKELQDIFHVESFKVEPFSKEKRIELLNQYWKNRDENLDSELVNKCAQTLVQHLNPDMLNTPQKLLSIANYFQLDSLNDFENEIRCLKDSALCEILVKDAIKKINILNCEEVHHQLESLALASENYLKKLVGNMPDLLKLDQIISTGICFYNENDIQFSDDLKSFFISKFMMKTLLDPPLNFPLKEEFLQSYTRMLKYKDQPRLRQFLNDYMKENCVVSDFFLKQHEMSEDVFIHTLNEFNFDLCIFNLQLIKHLKEGNKYCLIKLLIQNSKLSWMNFEKIFYCIQKVLGTKFEDYFFKANDKNNLFYEAMDKSNGFFENFLSLIFKNFDVNLIHKSLMKHTEEFDESLISLVIEKRHKNHLLCIMNNFNKSDIAFETFFGIWKKVLEKSFMIEDMDMFNSIRNKSYSFSTAKCVEMQEVTEKYDHIITEIKEFHDNIDTFKNELLESFLLKNPNLKCCYYNNISALEKCVDAENPLAYSFLRKHKFTTLDKGEYDKKLNAEELFDFREKVGNANEENSKRNPDNHIFELLTKCRYDTKTTKESAQKVHESFKFINHNLVNKNIMKTIAYTKNKPTIFFDMVNENLSDMLPELVTNYDPDDDFGTCTNGLFNPNGNRLYIAKDVSDESRNGTIAHEMAHCALRIVYKNRCLPYEKNYKIRMAEWKEVVKKTKEMYENDGDENTEPIIAYVFKLYKGNDDKHTQFLHEAELAVRVPHIFAHYQKDPAKIASLRLKYEHLFKYFDDYVQTDLNYEYGTEIRELNDEFGLLESIIKDYDYETKDKIINTENKITVLKTNFQNFVVNKIYKEILKLQKNPTKLRTENLFLNLDDKNIKEKEEEYFNLINEYFSNSKGFKRLIIVTNSKSKKLNVFLKFLNEKTKVFIITSLSNFHDKFGPNDKNYSWDKFDEKSQSKLLKLQVAMNNVETELEYFISSADENNDCSINQLLTPEVLNHLITNRLSKISINCTYDEGKNSDYITRILERIENKETRQFSENELVKKVVEKKYKSFIISDSVGSGKTETLKELTRKIRKNYPHFWVSFFMLNKSVLQEENIKDIKEFMGDKILNLNSPDKLIEKTFFEYLFEKKQVIFLFDGFDEVSSDCKPQVLKMLASLKESGKVKMWVTSRQHLEGELKKILVADPFTIISLTKEQQVSYLKTAWSNDDERYDEETNFAENLVDQLTICVKGTDFFGKPLQTFLLSEIFKESSERVVDIQELSFTHVFSKFFDRKKNIWRMRLTNETLLSISERKLNPIQIHQFFALSFFNNDKKCMFNMRHDEKEWSLNDIQMCGIITLDADGKLRFIHQSLAEFLIAIYIKDFLCTFSEIGDEFSDLFLNMLCNNKYSVVRYFFNQMVAEVNLEVVKVRKLAEGLCNKINRKEHSMLLSIQIQEKSINLLYFTLNICSKFVPVTSRFVSIKDCTLDFNNLIQSSDLEDAKKVAINQMFENFAASKKIFKLMSDILLRFIYFRTLPIENAIDNK